VCRISFVYVRMAQHEGMNEVGQIVVAVLTAVAIAALTKYGFFPDEGPEGSGGGMPNIQINFGGTHHYGGNMVDPLEGGGDGEIAADDGRKLIGRMEIRNKRNQIIQLPARFRNNATGNRIVVVLDKNWGLERMIGIVYFNPAYGWRMGHVEFAGENGSAHFVCDIAPDATSLRVLTNRNDDQYDQPVSRDAALRYLQGVVPDDSEDTFLDLTRRALYLFTTDLGQEVGLQLSFEQLANRPRPNLIPAIFCPKRNVFYSPDRPLSGRT
jgi:hypothetical protein